MLTFLFLIISAMFALRKARHFLCESLYFNQDLEHYQMVFTQFLNCRSSTLATVQTTNIFIYCWQNCKFSQPSRKADSNMDQKYSNVYGLLPTNSVYLHLSQGNNPRDKMTRRGYKTMYVLYSPNHLNTFMRGWKKVHGKS